MLGGESWTSKWLKFDNSYFTEGGKDDSLLWLPTDKALQTDQSFKPHFEAYAKSQEKFFEDYADVHRRLSELGSTFAVPGWFLSFFIIKIVKMPFRL